MRKCKVCSSIHREVYEEYIRNGATLKELVDLAKELGEDISIASFSRHKKYHMDKEIDKIYREQLKKEYIRSLDIKKEIYDLLVGLKETFNKLLEKENVNPKALADVSRELRQTLKEIDNFFKGEYISSDYLIRIFIKALKDIPYEYQMKVLNTLKEYNLIGDEYE